MEQTEVAPSRPSSLFSAPRRSRQQSGFGGTTLTILSPVGQPMISIFSPTNGPSIVTLHTQETREVVGTHGSVTPFTASTINTQQLLDILQSPQTAAIPCSIEAIPRQLLASPVASTSNALSISNGDRPSPIASALTLPHAVTVNATLPPESNATATGVQGSNTVAVPRKRGRPAKNRAVLPSLPTPDVLSVSTDAAQTQPTRKRKSDVSLAELAGFPPAKQRPGRPRSTKDSSKWSASKKPFLKKPQSEKNLSTLFLIRVNNQ